MSLRHGRSSEADAGRPMRPALALARQNLRLMRADSTFLLTILVMPVILMAFFKPMAREALHLAGYHGANGAEQVVPGMTVGFGIFLLGYVAFGFMNEHGWGTWERLRASPARPAEIVVGKLVPAVALVMTYELTLFAIGVLAFDLRFHGRTAALVLTGVAFPICLVSIGIFVAAVVTSNEEVNAATNIGGLFLAALGGAYVPLSLLPAWARTVAPVTPTYWAVKGFRAGILPGTSLAAVTASTAALIGFATLFAIAASLKFHFEETKVGG